MFKYVKIVCYVNFNVIINRSRQSIINFYHIKIDTKVGFTQSNIVISDKNNEGSSLHTRLIKDNVTGGNIINNLNIVIKVKFQINTPENKMRQSKKFEKNNVNYE